jgi:hypothetical protein
MVLSKAKFCWGNNTPEITLRFFVQQSKSYFLRLETIYTSTKVTEANFEFEILSTRAPPTHCGSKRQN